jgi:photoactive yellow protein
VSILTHRLRTNFPHDIPGIASTDGYANGEIAKHRPQPALSYPHLLRSKIETRAVHGLAKALQAYSGNSDSVICAWCERQISEGGSGKISYGICLTCLGDNFTYAIENVGILNREVADLLPYGFIRLDEDGIVLEYNTTESALSGLPREGVLGRNFFRSVAPCTCVKEFEGRVREMIAGQKADRDEMQFLFKFPGRVTNVTLAMTYDPSRHEVILLIRKVKN